MLQLDESSNGQEIQLHSGQQFEIRLPEIPTTGFRWSLVSSGEPACVALDNFYKHPVIQAPGAEGNHHWRFQAVQAGQGTIDLVYQRPWEHAENPARRFTLNVRVTE
jgi:inhibitor of cysteine peptidase